MPSLASKTRPQPARRDDSVAALGRIVSGYAACFYREDDPGTEYQLWDDTVEHIMPGAFDRALTEKDDVRALFNHDSNLLLGRVSAGTCRVWTDDVGLAYEVRLPEKCSYADDLIACLKRGDVTGSSFGFLITDEAWRELKDPKGNLRFIREILAVRLYDISPVVFPAYPGTTAGLRSQPTPQARTGWEIEQENMRMRLRLLEH